VKYVEKARAGWQTEVLSEAVDTAHRKKHSNRRAQSKEVTRSEDQLWIADHWHSSATSSHNKIHRRTGCGSQQRITDAEQQIGGLMWIKLSRRNK